jgi:protein BUR2
MSPVDPLPFPSNEVLLRAQSQWLFTSSELLRTPSILDGLSPAQEHSNRSKGVNFITQVGILLKLPQLTLATASVYLHRFYVRHSMVDLPSRPGLHHYAIAATSLFLATKVEENCRKMKELVVACCRVAQKQPNLVVDEQNKEYWRWRDTILVNEDLLLEALCFDLALEHPYRILFDVLCYYNVQDNKRLRNAAWAFVNDSNLTTLCLLYPARTIAAAALYAAAKHTEVAFPDDDWGRPWWEHLGLDIGELRKACSVLAEAYEENPLPRQGEKGLYVKEEEGVDEDDAKTRLFPSSRNIDVGSVEVEEEEEEEEERPAAMTEGSEEGEV